MSRNLIHVLKAVLKTDLRDFSSKFEKAGGDVEKFRRGWDKAAGGIKKAATRITAATAGVAAGVATMVAKVGIEFNAMQEQAEIAFTTMLGSQSKAKAFMGELREFAKKTPFEMPGLVKSAQLLLAFNFQAEEIIPTLTAIGDATAGLGGSPELLKQITRALGQIKAKGVVSAEEMLQLAEAGVPAWDILAKKMGVDIPAAMDKVKDRAVDADFAIGALIEGMNAKFGGLMAQQATTFSGMLSTIKDTLKQSAGQLMQPLFERLKDFTAEVAKALESPEFEAALNRIGDRAKEAFENIFGEIGDIDAKDIVGALEQAAMTAIQVLESLGKVAARIGPSLLKLATSFAEVASWIFKVVDAVPGLATALVALRVGSMLGLTQAVSGLITMLTSLSGAFGAAGASATAAAGPMAALLGPAGIIALAAVATYAVVKKLQDMNAEIDATVERAKKAAKEVDAHLTDVAKAEGKQNREGIEKDIIGGLPITSLGDRAAKALRKKNLAQKFAQENLKRGDNNVDSFLQAMREANRTIHDVKRMIPRAVEYRINRNLEFMASLGATRGQIQGSGILDGVKDAVAKLNRDLQTGALSPERGAEIGEQISRKFQEATQNFINENQKMWQAEKQAKIDAALAAKLEEEKRDERRAKLPGFGKLTDLLATPNISGTGAVTAASSVAPTATPEALESLRVKFEDLRARAELTGDNINSLVDEFLTDVQNAKLKTDEAKTRAEAFKKKQAAIDSAIAKTAAVISGTDAGEKVKKSFQEQMTALADQASWGAITMEEFQFKLKELNKAFLEAAKGAEVAAVKTTHAGQKMAQGGGGFGLGRGGGPFGMPAFGPGSFGFGGQNLGPFQFVGYAGDAFSKDVASAGESFKQSIEDSRPLIQQIFDQLFPSPHPFVGVSGEAGLYSTPGQDSVTMNFYPQQMNDADLRRAYSMLDEERMRRGRPMMG